LGHLIVANCDAARKVIGTDIHYPGHTTSDSSVEFRLASDTATVPLDTDEADTVVIRYALHHMQWEVQQKMLGEVRRVLAPGGRLLILENSFSRSASARLADELGFEHRTRDIEAAGLLTALLTALDTFSLFVKDKFGPFPSTYRAPEEWCQLLSSIGLPASYEYMGYPMHDLHQAPLTVLRCN
jgi:SAM-dependent methyltransferase